jgi:hypothetical protein
MGWGQNDVPRQTFRIFSFGSHFLNIEFARERDDPASAWESKFDSAIQLVNAERH